MQRIKSFRLHGDQGPMAGFPVEVDETDHGKAMTELYDDPCLRASISTHPRTLSVFLRMRSRLCILESGRRTSYGLPVLVSSIPANMELVSEEDTFKPGDVAGLASKLRALMKAPSPCPLPQGERVRKERLKMLKTEFNWDRIAEQTLDVYKRVLRGDKNNT